MPGAKRTPLGRGLDSESGRAGLELAQTVIEAQAAAAKALCEVLLQMSLL